MKTYSFIDAANIIYGTRDEGWKVDFKKLFKYLTERYKCRKVYYFAGLDEKNPKQQKFYRLLSKIGYDLKLKPVKLFKDLDGKITIKANCDVDLTFYAMRDLEKFERIILLSGDGDFEILMKHFLKLNKQVIVFANARRTAREIKSLRGIQFNDLGSFKQTIEFHKKRR